MIVNTCMHIDTCNCTAQIQSSYYHPFGHGLWAVLFDPRLWIESRGGQPDGKPDCSEVGRHGGAEAELIRGQTFRNEDLVPRDWTAEPNTNFPERKAADREVEGPEGPVIVQEGDGDDGSSQL